MMHIPRIRMGLVPQALEYEHYDGGLGMYSALALRPNHSHAGQRRRHSRQSSYGGVRWAYKKSKRQSCAGYDQAVRDWEKAKSNFKKAGCKMTSFLGLRRGKCYDLGNKMKSIESRGKAAWSTCKAGLPEDVVDAAESDIAIDPLTGLPVGTEYDDYGDEEENGGGMLYGVAALMVVAAVGVVVVKRMKKKGK